MPNAVRPSANVIGVAVVVFCIIFNLYCISFDNSLFLTFGVLRKSCIFN